MLNGQLHTGQQDLQSTTSIYEEDLNKADMQKRHKEKNNNHLMNLKAVDQALQRHSM